MLFRSLLFRIVLPNFSDALPAMLVLLPGVMSLSLSKILTSYVSGRGRPGPVSVAAVAALAINIGANVLLIPALGIIGAAAASLISYTSHATIMVVVTSRMTGQRALSLIVPGRTEFERLIAGLRAMGALLRDRGRRAVG